MCMHRLWGGQTCVAFIDKGEGQRPRSLVGPSESTLRVEKEDLLFRGSLAGDKGLLIRSDAA